MKKYMTIYVKLCDRPLAFCSAFCGSHANGHRTPQGAHPLGLLNCVQYELALPGKPYAGVAACKGAQPLGLLNGVQ